jgi:predicted transcriptional regulator
MADTVPIELDAELKRRIDDLARQSGRSPDDVIREALDRYSGKRNGGDSPNADGESLYDALDRAGLIGCIEGPGDKSTDPKYFESFGRD